MLLRRLCLVSTPPCRFRGRFAGRRSRWGVFLPLDLAIRCSSTSGAEFEFWRPGTLCWSPVPSTLRRLENLSIFLVRGYGSSFLPPTSGRSFIGGTSAWSCPLLRLNIDCCLSSLRAGVCSLLWQRRIPAWVLMVACLPLLQVGRTAPSHVPLMLCASTGFPVNPGLF